MYTPAGLCTVPASVSARTISYMEKMHDHSPSWFVLRSKATADIGYEALVPPVIFTALAALMVALRWCSRICARSAKIELEDYFVTAALVSINCYI
jgi:hypothetical protein